MKGWTVDEETGLCSAPSIHVENPQLTRLLVALSSLGALYERVLPELGRVHLVFQAEKHLDIWRFPPSFLAWDLIDLLALNCPAFHVLA